LAVDEQARSDRQVETPRQSHWGLGATSLYYFGKEGKPEPTIAVSQETLAEMIGTTRSRVSTFMNKFRKLGFITYNGELEVHNSLLNVVLHDAPQLRRKGDD
jgi:CRP-like cAMP-binding protein